MYAVVDAWHQHVMSRVNHAKLTAFQVDVADGSISVHPCPDGEYLCRIHFPGAHGSRDIARAPLDQVLALVHDQISHGISFPPLYHAGTTEHEISRDGRVFRKILPEGELRLVPHADGFIGVLVLANGLRLLGWSDDLEIAHESSRRLIHADISTRMSVRVRGRLRDLKVSPTKGILAHHSAHDLSIFLVPGTPYVNADGLWDAPVTVLVVRPDARPEHVWTHPSLANLDGHEVVWSDDWTPTTNQPRTDGAAPRVLDLFHRFLDSLDHTTGAGQSMRGQLDRLLRTCAQSSADIRGCGRQLRAALAERGGTPLNGCDRAFRHALTFFRTSCPHLVRRVGRRDTVIALGDLREGTPLAAWLEERFGEHTARPEPAAAPGDETIPGATTSATVDEPAPTGTESKSNPPESTTNNSGEWFDGPVAPDVAASVARYLGPPNPHARRATAHVDPLGRHEPTAGPPSPPSHGDSDVPR